jgi:ribosome hibernation promoting factor
MEIEFTGRQMEVTPDVKEFTRTHLRKLLRVLGDRFILHVILTKEKHRHSAELTLQFRGQKLVSLHQTSATRTAISGAVEKLEKQSVRLLQRRRTRKRRPAPTSAILLNVFASPHDHEERRVLETERIAIKPLSVAEAIEALDSSGSGVVVFRNQQTERVNVIYHREDGNLALIEPEP